LAARTSHYPPWGPNPVLTDTEIVAEGRFLKWTGHQVGVGVAFGVCMIGCLMVLSVEPLEWIALDRPLRPWVLLTGFGLAIPAFVGLCAFVRCPRCRARVIWHAFSRDSHPHGTSGLLAAARCPHCGFSCVPKAQTETEVQPTSEIAPGGATTNDASDADSVTSLEGSVEKIDGKLTLRIPLDAGGNHFVRCTRGISNIEGDCLKIVIQEWLAGMLRIEDGDLVVIDNANGKFNIRPVNPRSIH
jgi:DNA-directed RNA polymerase subunit RPC12/RpoP